ncbi:MAG: RNA-binding protein [Candidatus Thiodiazotropha taylori]|nr:RNA-binding protein [Candidatus Thiodiazotropha taylori]
MITLSVRGLPRSTTEASLTTLFSEYGTVRSLKLVKDLFSGECKGFATLDMEGHEARAAIAALDNSELNGSVLRVGPDRGKKDVVVNDVSSD